MWTMPGRAPPPSAADSAPGPADYDQHATGRNSDSAPAWTMGARPVAPTGADGGGLGPGEYGVPDARDRILGGKFARAVPFAGGGEEQPGPGSYDPVLGGERSARWTMAGRHPERSDFEETPGPADYEPRRDARTPMYPFPAPTLASANTS